MKGPLGSHTRSRWEDNIKIGPKEVVQRCVNKLIWASLKTDSWLLGVWGSNLELSESEGSSEEFFDQQFPKNKYGVVQSVSWLCSYLYTGEKVDIKC